MGRAKRVVAGTRTTGLAVEYVRTRKVVRVLGWLGDEPIAPVEIPLAELSTRLGIDPRDLGAPRRFLLFAGSHRTPAGGLRDLVGSFESEDEAWAAFRALRQAHPSSQGWAELATIDRAGQVNQLAWFGLHPADHEKSNARSGPARERDRRRPLRRLLASSSAEATPYLRAVTPS